MTCSRHYDILAKTHSRMRMFSCQNDAGSQVSNDQYWENLVLVVVLVSEFKALHYIIGRYWMTPTWCKTDKGKNLEPNGGIFIFIVGMVSRKNKQSSQVILIELVQIFTDTCHCYL